MFDTSKPYGTIGGVHGIARFEQDGKYYDAQHNLLDNDGNPLKAKATKAESKGNKTPKGNAPVNDEEKKALVARAKELKIVSPHLFSVDKLKEKIAEAEGALNADNQLAANLGD